LDANDVSRVTTHAWPGGRGAAGEAYAALCLFAGLAVSESVHLNRFDGCGFAVHHASNSFRSVSAEHRFAAVKADGCRNLLNAYGLPIDVKHLVYQFLTALSFSAYMTVKHGYLRLA
jgi:hypothetical protein